MRIKFNLNDCASYILNEINIPTYLKYNKINNVNISDVKNKHKKVTDSIQQTIYTQPKNSLFVPKEYDTLFWCYYIMSNGDADYEMLYIKNTVITKQLKIKLVDKIRSNKIILKQHKFDSLLNIETNLVNDNMVTISTFFALCAIENINVIFVNKNTYFKLLMNDTDVVYLIKKIENNSTGYEKYGVETISSEKINEIQSTLYRLYSMSKPFKAISGYNLEQLIEIANKLSINIYNSDGKKKLKKEIYELIIQCI